MRLGRWRTPGLRMRVVGLIAACLAAVLLAFAYGARQEQASHDAFRLQAAQALQEVAQEGMRRRGEAIVSQLAEALVNPVYYFDLAQVGEIVGSALALPDIAYVLVFDADGRVLHDGSPDIAGFGREMDDALAYDAVRTTVLLTQQNDALVDVAMPIRIGSQRLGGVRVGMSLQAQLRHAELALRDLDEGSRMAGERSHWLLLAAVAVLVLTAILVVVALTLWVVLPIQRIAAAAREVARGRFDVQLPGRRGDEIGELERGFVAMARSLERHHNEVRRIAYSDPLTGLANRLSFREQVDQGILVANTQGRQLALLFIDLDDFKRINDALGHEAGDLVLEEVAARLSHARQAAGSGEVMLARLGGDEFVMLLTAAQVRDRAEAVGRRVIEEVSRPYNVFGKQAFLGASVGITLYPDDASDTRSLLKAGDIAMYEAKLAGKNCLRFYNAALDQAVAENGRIEQALRGAWERGELTLCFQPIEALAERRLVGAEALLRWSSPLLGQVQPGVFVGIAERAGLIEDIGRRVLFDACRAAAEWPAVDAVMPFVAVNVSALQLRRGDLVGHVQQALAASRLAPARLHLELTETAVMSEAHDVVKQLNQLAELGVEIWLDDFGTGFSGLSHLRRLPVDGVKIDKSFVENMPQDADDLALTSAVMAMAQTLGYTVVAEGVENEAQYQLLLARNCDYGQGYWLGEPMAEARFLERLREPLAAER